MSTAYLFRIDGASDNDAFFLALKPTVSQVYAGLDLKLGDVGWSPDFVRIEVDQELSKCSITIIELEAVKSVALTSCRKYLPERSADIVRSFVDYLDRVIRQCSATADPRAQEFGSLRTALAKSETVSVATAGALRSARDYVEFRPLFDQPEKFILADHKSPLRSGRKIPEMCGIVSLSAEEVNIVTRCILVIDAVVRKCDHSIGTLHTWRGQTKSQPLKVLLKRSSGHFSLVQGLILTKGVTRGMRIDFDGIFTELGQIWQTQNNIALPPSEVRKMIEGFYPIATGIGGNDRMPSVFEKARAYLADRQD